MTRRPGFFFDLGQQALRFVPESGPARRLDSPAPLRSVLARVDDTFWLPRVGDASWHRSAVETLRERGIPRLLERCDDLSFEPSEQEVVVDLPIHSLLTENRAPVPRVGSVLVVPWISGFTARPAVWEPVLEAAVAQQASALVLIRPELDDSAKRELARLCVDDRQYSELFHTEAEVGEEALRSARSAVRSTGLGTVVERALPAGPERLRRNRRVAAALLTVAEVSRDLSEARREDFSRAARFVESEQRDLLAIVDDGNLSVLEWLPEESHPLVREVVEAGDDFRLSALEKGYCSSTPM